MVWHRDGVLKGGCLPARAGGGGCVQCRLGVAVASEAELEGGLPAPIGRWRTPCPRSEGGSKGETSSRVWAPRKGPVNRVQERVGGCEAVLDGGAGVVPRGRVRARPHGMHPVHIAAKLAFLNAEARW